jgi:hypothetical protein
VFCPQCKAEYRQGFTRCSDCDVDLVHELPRDSVATQSLDDDALTSRSADGGMRPIWRGIVQDYCVSLCYTLREHGITYKVNEAPGPRGPRLSVGRRYELTVPEEEYERAMAALSIEEDAPETFTEDDWKKLEEPEAADPVTDTQPEQDEAFDPDESADAERDFRLKRDAYFRLWYPEDATAEIWSKANSDRQADGIEMALKEHFIHCRVDKEGGLAKVFVQPQDESLARSVVQNIIEAVG